MTALHHAGAGSGLRRDILTTLLPAFDGPVAPVWVLDRLRDGLGGVCLFGSNVVSSSQLAALSASLLEANPGAVIAIDEEGGDVTRLFYDRAAPWPGNAVLGRLDDVALTEAVGREVGEALAAVGVNLTFAPDADVNSNPDNPVIGVRSFGADPVLVARHTAAWTRGVQSTGVGACAKHFPGHGDTAADSHLALPVVDLPLEALRERELVPFRAAVAAGVATIMTSHILLPQIDAELPVTLSPHVLHRLLRGELGYSGVIVTDALDMHGASGVHGIPYAAVHALAAGCDLLCIGADVAEQTVDDIVAAVEQAVASGLLPAGRVAEAAARVRALASARAMHRTTAPDVSAAPDVSGEPDVSGAPDRSRAADGSGAPDVAAPAVSVERVIDAFDVADGVLDRLAGEVTVGTVVRVDSIANIAIGTAPWGPFAAIADTADDVADEPAGSSRLESADLVALDPDHPLADPAALAGPVVVVGKDLHRREFAVNAIDALRAVRADVVVADLGWPGDDRAYADIATFGASRLVGEALVRFVEDALAAEPSAPPPCEAVGA